MSEETRVKLLNFFFNFPNAGRLRHGDKVCYMLPGIVSYAFCQSVTTWFVLRYSYRLHAAQIEHRDAMSWLVSNKTVKELNICMMHISLWLYKPELPGG